ncbi:carbohydrate ABC transporter permease [Paenibacillus nasutitermitis]|uniref:Sugar ABC transporter permease n=1 Tax=Paenibacillus nasutitermitis TaxID=1652958 RepID=A0A916ZCZ4_9BACL|nr:sugar ABC transporter permease [Paenibacillus nasutitermitis]GGD88873.1 sugar ABC transporter permease [Paenibacillus nasutitermitis]
MQDTLKAVYKARYLYLFLVIPFAFIGLFILYPFIRGFQVSLLEWSGGAKSTFVGLDNYKKLFMNEPLLGRAVKNILILTAASVAQAVGVSFVLAWTIHHIRNARSKYAFRILVIVPSLIPAVVGYLLWKKFYDPDGLVNRLLGVVGLDNLQQAWLGDTAVVVTAIALAGFPWVNGANTLIYLAGFLQIPKEMYEAAKMDGATVWRTLLHVEIPMIAGQTRILFLLSLIFSLQNYDNVFLLTQGGPMDASVVPGILLYKNAFVFGDYGYASAIGVFIFSFVFLLTLISMRMSKKDGEMAG